MNFKVAMVASALMAFAGIFTVGCGGTECDKANDAVAACGTSGTTTGDTGAAEPECTGAVECQAKCITAQSDICAIIGGTADAAALTSFADCVTACSSTM